MLVQVSGSDKTLAAATVKRALESVDDYVVRFSYKDDAEKKRYFKVKFDENRVNELLRRSSAPILAEERPNTIVWLVIAKEQDNPRFVSGESETELFQKINTEAKRRVIPLMFPLLDLADTEMVSEKTVWNDDFKTLQSASERYNVPVVWIGKLSKQASGWHGQWSLMINGIKGKAQTWDNSNENLEKLCSDAMDELARRLLRVQQASESIPLDSDHHYSEVPDPTIINPPDRSRGRYMKSRSQVSRFRLSVSGIKNIEQYTKLQVYLKSLPGVQEVEASAVNADQTMFDVVAL